MAPDLSSEVGVPDTLEATRPSLSAVPIAAVGLAATALAACGGGGGGSASDSCFDAIKTVAVGA